jgi:hypothetical protein
MKNKKIPWERRKTDFIFMLSGIQGLLMAKNKDGGCVFTREQIQQKIKTYITEINLSSKWQE